MTKSEMEQACEDWLSERLDPKDKEGLAQFQKWLEQGAKDPRRSITVQEVVAAWQRVEEQRKLH